MNTLKHIDVAVSKWLIFWMYQQYNPEQYLLNYRLIYVQNIIHYKKFHYKLYKYSIYSMVRSSANMCYCKLNIQRQHLTVASNSKM